MFADFYLSGWFLRLDSDSVLDSGLCRETRCLLLPLGQKRLDSEGRRGRGAALFQPEACGQAPPLRRGTHRIGQERRDVLGGECRLTL
ncbi:hypothetical protein Q5P01_018841 [Channa striata]|uniref:Uncharacterized protein n=1 Tax=Channa striata TaxID=64152 RepID=A0AA88M5R4_CHASR|nr:hypothetical protein Q5P01_018841 [Channa striata]